MKPEYDLYQLELGNNFLNALQKTSENREEVDNLELVKIKNFCASEVTINKEHNPSERCKYLQIMFLIRIVS